MTGDLGLKEAVAIALGGMIGGGIYAVLGVVTGITGAATWFAFVLAGVVALSAGYSYIALSRLADQPGGSVTFVQSFTGRTTLAGMVGWTLLFGYVGSMAMYAFAFAEFALSLPGLPTALAGLPLRPVVSVLAVAGFVGLNLLGARASGSAENVLVAVKIVVLVAFGVGGIAYISTAGSGSISPGFETMTSFNPIMAAAVSFVAFQGWQLLFYDQESIENAAETVPKAVYISIPLSVAIYVLVAVATFAIAPEALQQHPHTALVTAAETILSPLGLASLGGLIIAGSAVVSTGSAINATLFSAGHFAKGMLTDDLLPDRLGDADADGVPERTLLVLGGITAAFSAWGSLNAITTFASLSFIVVFGAMSFLAFRHRDHDEVNALPPLVGTVGTLGFFPLMFYHLFRAERATFYMVLAIGAVVIAAELLYFERERLASEVREFQQAVEARFGG